MTGAGFGAFVRRAHHAGRLVVQPRMGMSSPQRMRAGLLATRDADATTVGTLTLDSYTRVGDLESAQLAVLEGVDLNGYPLVSHETATTRRVLDGIHGPQFPVQVRHGSAAPQHIFRALTAVGLDASEGGPVSYCLPYGRVPLRDSVAHWTESCEHFATLRRTGAEPHLETFGGCVLGQLCPPGLLVAVSVLEALFFRRHGIRSISVSYAQQTNRRQDSEAVAALRSLCTRFLSDTEWHVVVYAYMGLFPETEHGARRLLAQAAELAVQSGSERLIVKTVAESRRIPSVAENVSALEHAAAVAARTVRDPLEGTGTETYAEAYALVDAVLNLDDDLGTALLRAFSEGRLDVPYCLHPDNAGLSRSYIAEDGRLCWSDVGKMPLSGVVDARPAHTVTSSELLASLSYVRRSFDDHNALS
ncbi:methylaspartate mutase [[Kitasatospora] papulosa]|uniref:Methylaspartate mutase n=2 Tax=Streptomyces TaxID=1883 RepID=A0A8D3WF03_STRFA|nr:MULTISPECIES: methylaspartate mutase [Streptomyces]MYT49841.1 methylaspartate mutase [Streptomyces sp. SID7815]MYT57581.1 methylaspartate mutase [Streptomyces sp. SID7834]RAS29136.1 glutamate mutase subunit E [Streptomyces avidinii]SNX78469.1 Glutamate mutase subunit E [Streptomyces microflavus]AGJ58291.1 putative glutamate mutase subumit E [Streptomyces sp. PAMC 26508]